MLLGEYVYANRGNSREAAVRGFQKILERKDADARSERENVELEAPHEK
jgi:hypothetical protein